jgi:hypothetical protein
MSKPVWAMVFFLLTALANGAYAFESKAKESNRRKTELRSALQAQNLVVQHNAQGAGTPAVRQLTEQERVNLRQQIRQQRL